MTPSSKEREFNLGKEKMPRKIGGIHGRCIRYFNGFLGVFC